MEEVLNSMATLTSIGGERRAQVTYAGKNEGVYETLRTSAWKDSKGLSFLFGVIYIMNGERTLPLPVPCLLYTHCIRARVCACNWKRLR